MDLLWRLARDSQEREERGKQHDDHKGQYHQSICEQTTHRYL
jgi:hypothetical protein